MLSARTKPVGTSSGTRRTRCRSTNLFRIMIYPADCSFDAPGIKELKYMIYEERLNNWHQGCHSCRLVPKTVPLVPKFGTRARLCGTSGTKMNDTSIKKWHQWCQTCAVVPLVPTFSRMDTQRGTRGGTRQNRTVPQCTTRQRWKIT
jgi:hypothetical protein